MSLKQLFKEKPLGLKIIIIIYSFASLLYFLISIISFTSRNLIEKIPDFNISALEGPIGPILIGIIFLGLAIFLLFVSKGILQLRNWARVALIIFCSINILGGIFSIIKGDLLSLINLVFNIIVASYLTLDKKVKRNFKPY